MNISCWLSTFFAIWRQVCICMKCCFAWNSLMMRTKEVHGWRDEALCNSEEVFLESKNLDHPKVTSGAEKCHPNIGLRKPFFWKGSTNIGLPLNFPSEVFKLVRFFFWKHQFDCFFADWKTSHVSFVREIVAALGRMMRLYKHHLLGGNLPSFHLAWPRTNHNWATKKRAPGWLGFIGDDILPSYIWWIKKAIIRIPINQPV